MSNSCIFLISARKEMLKECLTYLDKNYNCNYNHDILIFYHGSKYDDLEFQNSISNINPQTKYSFHKLEYHLPSHIKEKELFYHRKNIPYVRNCFPKSREGYLHANYFWNNFMNYPELIPYTYLIRIDDDSWFKKKVDFNFFTRLKENNKLCGTGYSWNYVHHRVLDTRIGFFQWVKYYVKKYNIQVKNSKLQKYLLENENDIIDGRRCHLGFQSLPYLCGNFNIYDRKMFDLKEWKQYLKEFNDFGGGFKFRWGDCEVISLFYYIHIGETFLDLDLKNKGIYLNQLPNVTMIKNGLE